MTCMAGNFPRKQGFYDKNPDWIFFHVGHIYNFWQKSGIPFQENTSIGQVYFKIHNMNEKYCQVLNLL